jgi:hypothetical protein
MRTWTNIYSADAVQKVARSRLARRPLDCHAVPDAVIIRDELELLRQIAKLEAATKLLSRQFCRQRSVGEN